MIHCVNIYKSVCGNSEILICSSFTGVFLKSRLQRVRGTLTIQAMRKIPLHIRTPYLLKAFFDGPHYLSHIHRFESSQEVYDVTLLTHVDDGHPVATLLSKQLSTRGLTHSCLTHQQDRFVFQNTHCNVFKEPQGMSCEREQLVARANTHL